MGWLLVGPQSRPGTRETGLYICICIQGKGDPGTSKGEDWVAKATYGGIYSACVCIRACIQFSTTSSSSWSVREENRMILLVLCVCVHAVLTVLLRVVGCVCACMHTLNYGVWACSWELLLSFTAHWPCRHGSVSASPLSGYQHQHLPTVLHADESMGLQEQTICFLGLMHMPSWPGQTSGIRGEFVQEEKKRKVGGAGTRQKLQQSWPYKWHR